MRILMLNYEFPPLGGGGGVAAYKLAKGFVQLGHKVDYVTSWFKGLKKFEVVDGINVYRVRVIGRKELPTATITSMVTYPFVAYFKAKSLHKKRKYDFINTQFAIPTGPVGVWLSKEFKIVNILSLHGGDIYDPSKKNSPHRKWYLRLVVRWVLNNSSILVAQSTNTRENTMKYYNPQKDIQIIPLPYETVKFSKISRKGLGLNIKKKYLISVGRLIPRKDYTTLIKALALVKNKDVELLIIGDGPQKQKLLELSNKLNVNERVNLLGFVPEDKKFQYLSNSDIYVLSSLHEGFGIVLQEAMQVGLPIIATDNGGQVDLVINNKNGLLFSSQDYLELSKKISILLKDERSANQFIKYNNRLIPSFSSKVIASKYLKEVYG